MTESELTVEVMMESEAPNDEGMTKSELPNDEEPTLFDLCWSDFFCLGFFVMRISFVLG